MCWMVLFAMIVWIIYVKMITNMAVIEYIYKIYSITAMLVIIFEYTSRNCFNSKLS